MKRREFIKLAAVGTGIGTSGIPLGIAGASSRKPDIRFSKLPRWRGFNLQEKFTHKPDEWLTVAPQWGMSNEPFRESDFEWIAEFGFDFVRLPMSYKCWTDENDWYKIKEDKLKEIDEAVAYGEQYGLHVSINFHRAPGYTVNDMSFKEEHREAKSLWDDQEALDACAFHWRLFAERYKGLSNKRISFNLLNEPFRTTEDKHDRVIRRLVGDIKEIDPDRLILIDGFNFRPSFNLTDLEIAQCPRGYAPGELTHYKSTWSGKDADLWQEPDWPMKSIYNGKILDKEYLLENFKPWKDLEQEGVGLHVGEFGVYNRTPHPAALAWMEDILEIWKEAGWGWALWCFRGSFGILDSGRTDVKYDNFRGHQLDRRMLELLRRY
jgi:endoglucanase